MRRVTILFSLALVLLMTSAAMPQNYARESFEYPTGASLDTLVGTATNGWDGPWKFDKGTRGITAVADTGLHYADLDYAITNIGNHIQVSLPGNWAEVRHSRTLDKIWPDKAGVSYWTSHIFEAKVTPTGNTYYLFKLFHGGDELFAVGKSGGGTVWACGSGWAGGTGDDVSKTTAEGATPIWFVTRTVMSGDTKQERTFMWINPDPNGAEPDTSNADVKRWTDKMNNGFDNVRVECGGELANDLSFDEIRLGTDWASVSSPTGQVTDVATRPAAMPGQFALSQNYPNPFNPTTTIHFTVRNNGKVRLSVYDILGREVAVLVNGMQKAGEYDVSFSSEKLGAGVYFYRLQTADLVITRKMTLLK